MSTDVVPVPAVRILDDAFGRIRELVHGFADVSPSLLGRRPAAGANSIAWLVWHLTRVQDSHIAELLDADQLWVDGHARALGRPPDPDDTGYGHSEAEAAAVEFDDVAALLAYHDAVADRTVGFLATLETDDLERVIDDSYDPPVTVGMRLVSVVADSLQHVGQAAYARGLVGA